ncbi:MAG: F0F1 ATP synthase subunit delta [Candidatus Paceibacterota bacterium]
MKKEKEVYFWAMALYRAVKDNPEKRTEIFVNLKKALVKKQETLPAIIKKFGKIYNAEEKALVSSAKNLKEEEKKEISEKAKRILDGKKEVEYSLDESLLGGFRLKTKDVLIKASLKDVLAGLKKLYGHN